MKLHHHRRNRVYLSHLFRVYRPIGGGIGLVIWRHEFSVSR